MGKLAEFISTTNNWITAHILVVMLIGMGIYFTTRTGFVQIRLFGQMVKQVLDSRDVDGDGISSFQAFAIGIVSWVGTGNIAGVVIAVTLGGPGAVFWMWFVAFLGMATTFIEATPAQLFKIRWHDGTFRGGPAFYTQRGLGSRKWGVVFAPFLTCSFEVSFEIVQTNTIADTLKTRFEVNPWVTTAILLVLCGLIVCRGLKAVAKASEIVAPLTAIMYIGLAAAVVVINLDKVGLTFSLIIENAFGLREALGDLAGSMIAAMMNGVRRGLLSNEAGEGSAPNAASTAHVTHPAKQGLIQSAGAFIDTILVCPATAFILFNADPEALKPYWTSPDPAGANMTTTAFEPTLGAWAGSVMVVLICVFAGSLVIGDFAYAEINMDFLTKSKAWGDKLLKAVVIASIVLGSVAELKFVRNFADLTVTGMALINIVSIVMLGKWAFRALQDYLRNRERPFVATGNPSMPGELPTDIWVHGGTDSPSGSPVTIH